MILYSQYLYNTCAQMHFADADADDDDASVIQSLYS